MSSRGLNEYFISRLRVWRRRARDGVRGTHPFINLPVLQLDEAGADGRDVALLIGEGHSPRPFGILEFGVRVDPSVTHAPIQAVHDHGELHWRSNVHGGVNGTRATPSTHFRDRRKRLPARRGRGTPPTKMVFLGSNG